MMMRICRGVGEFRRKILRLIRISLTIFSHLPLLLAPSPIFMHFFSSTFSH
ncbi:unnamed protein product [Brassica napus]|uniref:(rape) hypothetical protein n=1 Tax=Brassica napus TaxID=3708 RepID=A0A816ME04_BRANA|nr:unnamed protein product [Brassica napus]